jgi:nucleotidyltransferase/DNA polymerase involved in DNA repair
LRRTIRCSGRDRANFGVYREVSLQIRGIFAEHTEVIEPLSLASTPREISARAEEA